MFLLFLTAGVILSLGAMALALGEISFRHRAARTVGTIRDRHAESSPADGGSITTVTITVEFEDGTGTRRQATSPVITGGVSWQHGGKSYGSPEYAVGDQVPIVYDPQRPEEIKIDNWINQWFGAFVVGVVGVGFVAVGLVL